MEPDAQAVADQARGHAAEHLAQDKAARGGHGDDSLLVVGGAAVGQVLEARPLGIDPRAKAGVAAPDNLVDEPAVGGKIVEVARAPQQQRILDGPLEMARLRWPWRLSMAPFSWATPALLRLGAIP